MKAHHHHQTQVVLSTVFPVLDNEFDAEFDNALRFPSNDDVLGHVSLLHEDEEEMIG